MELFDQIVGHETACSVLKGAITHNRIASAYLFAGASGVGKNLTARCFSQAILQSKVPVVQHPDLLYIQPTYQHQGKLLTIEQAQQQNLSFKRKPQIRMEQVRQIIQFLALPAMQAQHKVIIIDQGETMAAAAANALLKTLEEPGKATVILLTTSVAQLLPTIVSRCALIPFRRLSTENLQQVLQHKGHQQVLDYPEILFMAQGSVGKAISAGEQLQAIPNELISQLQQRPSTVIQALSLAREIDQVLAFNSQLWLTEFLQNYDWFSSHHRAVVEVWETLRRQLKQLAQPRLVWEVALLEQINVNARIYG